MRNRRIVLSANTQQSLSKMGNNIRKARLRKNISAMSLAKMSGISHDTLAAIEKGYSSVSIGGYAIVLETLGLEKDFEAVAYDEEGRKEYWDDNLFFRKRATKGR